MVKKGFVDVVIPCWGEYFNYLSESVASVYAQDYPNVELFVVSKGGSVAKSMNFGALLGDGEFLLFLGADDLLDSAYISECLKLFDDSKVGFVYTGTKPFGSQVSVLSEMVVDSLMFPKGVSSKYSVFGNIGGQTGAGMIRRSAFFDVGCFDESLSISEDRDLLIRLVFAGWSVGCISKPLHCYRFHDVKQMHETDDSLVVLSKRYPLLFWYRYFELFFDNPLLALKRLYRKVFF